MGNLTELLIKRQTENQVSGSIVVKQDDSLQLQESFGYANRTDRY